MVQPGETASKVTHSNANDDECGKLFVGGLSWETNSEKLEKYFIKYGRVTDCIVMINSETKRSRGFGFVTFEDPSNVEKVLSAGPHVLDGRTIDPKKCNPRSMQKFNKRTGLHPKVFLGGLPPNVTETDLRDAFQTYGNVKEVIIMYDQNRKKPRGFGFLSFDSESSVNAVVSDRIVNVKGKQVEVKRAEPRDTGRANVGQNNEMYNSLGPQYGPTQTQQQYGPVQSQQQSGYPLGYNNSMQHFQGWGGLQSNQGYGPANSQAWNTSPVLMQTGPISNWNKFTNKSTPVNPVDYNSIDAMLKNLQINSAGSQIGIPGYSTSTSSGFPCTNSNLFGSDTLPVPSESRIPQSEFSGPYNNYNNTHLYGNYMDTYPSTSTSAYMFGSEQQSYNNMSIVHNNAQESMDNFDDFL